MAEGLASGERAPSAGAPLFAVAPIFTGLPGVLAVCAVLAVIAIVTARSQ